MDSLDLQVLSQARDWHAQGHAVWLVTVLETWGSAPRPPGALLALRDDGPVVGSVSGGCVEDDLIHRVRQGERVTAPALVSYGVTREEYHVTWDVPGTGFSREMPDDFVQRLQLDAHSALVALTHDPKLDDLALLEGLKSAAFYVGALGSRANTARRKERLAMFDLSPDEIGRLHGPVGLDLGGRTPAEIAVSIVAEIVAVKNEVAIVQKKPALSAG